MAEGGAVVGNQAGGELGWVVGGGEEAASGCVRPEQMRLGRLLESTGGWPGECRSVGGGGGSGGRRCSRRAVGWSRPKVGRR
ncbi:hypothetical protein M5K25_022320 [Dendrobium thyrsiflorum]|uniref:Uncharacterized protein n=1 Tax=Dendrobium thyrsiflorum TaxID=117978 RepID=A0ABD0U611_DENTH